MAVAVGEAQPLILILVRRVPLAIPIQADHARRVIHATRIPKMCCTSNDATTIVCLALTMREYCIPAYFALF